MTLNIELGIGCGSSGSTCVDLYGCPSNITPDFCIKRHDTMPSFKISVDDCDGVVDLTDENLVLEANFWSKAKLKKAIDENIDYLSFADNIGFNQVMQNDIIIMDRVRRPEHMLVIGFDEKNKLVRVQRGYNGTQSQSWEKGTSLRIFREMNASAEIQSIYEDLMQTDGTTLENQLTQTFLVFNWNSNTTCLPGCYWLEFKLLKMQNVNTLLSQNSEDISYTDISFTPSSFTPDDFGCSSGLDVVWERRFPVGGEGFLIKIIDSPTIG